jgi:hypothetical protein
MLTHDLDAAGASLRRKSTMVAASMFWLAGR